MRFKADKFCGIPCLCVSGTKVDGRMGSTDEWYFFRKSTSIISIIPTADRSDWDTIIINESSDEAELARCPGRHCEPLDPG